MPLDTLICGLCEETFTDLNEFVLHKQEGCAIQHHQEQQQLQQQPVKDEQTGTLPPSMPDISGMQQQEVPMEIDDTGQMAKLASQNDGDADTRVDSTDLTFLDDVHNMEAELGLDQPPDSNTDDPSTRTYVILKDAIDLETVEGGAQDQQAKMESAFTLEGTELEVLSTSQLMSQSAMNDSGTTTVIVSQEEFEAILQKQQQGHLGVDKPELPAKKPRVGRAKKGEGKNQILEAVPPSTPRPSAPETNADGKLACPRCKRTFTKERHFNTHKCLASSSYVDISKRDVVKIDSGDEEEEVSLYVDVDNGARDDEEDEFSAPLEESMQVEKEDEEDEHEMDKDEDVEDYHVGDNGVDDDDAGRVSSPKRRKIKRRGRPSRASKVTTDDKPVMESVNGNQMKQAVEAMENLPIFKNEEDKVAFEACIDIDLSQVDHMFRIHVIEQELNDLTGLVYNTPTVSSLSVYSCTVCEKVFKSLSHIRLHCITHTDLKPFKCHKCDYTTNSKGNLYTHMRKHTGQYYRCDQCDFKSVNKSHLVEHQMTHDSRRPTCLLCNKDYSTIKSMINHIRKYHTNKAGKEYLATFLSGRGQKGNTIIHQCHICNRKFKKRIDRDRHLFIHDIKDLPNVQMCELCDYWASRKVYLDKHYLKHRVIYCCAVCQLKFLSLTRLLEHLNTEHCSMEGNGILMSDDLVQECINKSYYLPEPVATTVEGNKYVNLPTVLTDTTQINTDQQEDTHQQGTQPLPHNDETNNKLENSETTNAANAVSLSYSSTEHNNNFTCEDSKKENDLSLSETVPETNSHLVGDFPVSVNNGDDNNGAVTSACSSTAESEFPFPTEFRDLIQESTTDSKNFSGEVQVQNLKLEGEKHEGLIMSSHEALPGDPLEGNSLQPELPIKEGINTLHGGSDNNFDVKSSTDDRQENPEDCDDVEKKETLPKPSEQGPVSVEDDTTATMLMLQNPGSDTEEKEEEEENLHDETGMEEGEVSTAPELAEDGENEGVEKEVNDDSDQNNICEEANSTDKGEKQTDSIQDGGDALEVKAESKEDKIQSLIQKMGYHKMTFDIFNKMRETFGTEECEYCGRLFYNKMDHESHIRTHTGDKPFACSQCSFRSTTRDGLRRHSEKEHEKIAYQCKECDFLAPTRTRLWNHQLKHLGITGLSCSQCPEKFDNMKLLRAHLINSHQDMDKEAMEKLTGWVRRPQGKMGRRSFKCPHCPRVFIRANSELQKHIWIHEGIKPFACPICPYACRSKNNLQAHMLRHSAEKPFSCSECGKEYKSKTALRWHVRSHKSGKLFKCDKCPYEATQSSHLKRHMEIHDVMKRFVCKHCKFSANTLGYMKIHYAKHHKGQPFIHEESSPPKDGTPNKGVYKCLSCGYLFGNMSDLKRHLKVRHHIQMQDIAGMDQMQISEVEVVQFEESALASNQPIPDVQQVLPTQITNGDFHQLRPQEDTGGMPASTASLIQQIFGMNQGEGQQVRVVSEDGQPLDISQDTIILQQDGQLLMTNDVPGSVLPGNQYIIQYFNPGEVSQEATIVGDNSAASNQPSISSVTDPDQIQLVQTVEAQLHHQQPSQPTQYIITSGGEIGPTQVTEDVIDHHSILQPVQSSLNNSVNQLVMATQTDVGTQLVSMNGQTHQILTTATTSTNQVENSVSENENNIISIDNHHQHHHPSQELLSAVVGEETQYVTSDVDSYSTQLIISDPDVVVEEKEIGDLVDSEVGVQVPMEEG